VIKRNTAIIASLACAAVIVAFMPEFAPEVAARASQPVDQSVSIGVGAMTAPTFVESSKAVAISVNRNDKGDRLPQASIHRLRPAESNTVPASSVRAPLGCDPAFSPVADPARAHIFRRCTA
jgi:hypothetical protein